MALIRSVNDLDFQLRDLPELPLADRVLMLAPDHFDVVYAINPHMQDARGRLNRVDRERAAAQWGAVRDAISRGGAGITVVPALPGAPDAVFCANPCLPVPGSITGGAPAVVRSRMMAAERRPEVAHLSAALEAEGYAPVELSEAVTRFEGMGDGLWHPRRRLLWGGVGPRTQIEAWAELAARFDLPVVALELVDPDFYHLDMVLALLNERTALWVPEALSKASRALVEALVPDLVRVNDREARRGFACNAFSPDGRHVVIQRGNAAVGAALDARGLVELPVETGEFMKAGGSVFCMKLQYAAADPG